jgi:ribosomal protein S18 acetylase RimI-like enzyme
MAATSGIEIRPATADQREAVQQLWDEAGLARATPDEWDAIQAGETTALLVALDGDRPVGAAIASFDGWRAYVYHVAVAADHRGQGLGRELLRQAEQFLLSAGARNVFVTVHEQNTEGLALVASEGYLPEGELVFVKRLATRVW